ncbi:DEAD/DEAH box helicase [Tissierella sp.]|uniref:DEAD/DEAH box helicase n=1 Tax=Tissierella sp. TaxID=41274 RepID=UPI00285EFB63|nr:DEAD/DEAH box helicase [Tissierella sp.]MDR7856514.1 DEAD/DEAH box helicase [Tissierella sp.]
MMEINFKDYNLSKELLKAIELLNFKGPTKVQKQVIPIALKEKDIVVKSQTGSGKTAAFAIPICQLVDWDENKPQALIITPTRELAMQVREDFFNIGRFKRLKALAVYGKAPIYNQERELKQKTHIVIGTPGRIIDHIERGSFDTSNIKYLVIDEADEMFNMGFLEQVETIIDSLPKERTTMLFSATMPSTVEFLSSNHMKDPVYVDIEAQNLTVDRIIQERYIVNENDKIELLKDITIIENPDSCIIFCNTREKVDEVYIEIKRANYSCDKIHGGMEQKDRTKVMESFKQGYFRYLVATDVAARGIDVDNITHVINYDIPRETESYVHRIGRTGRVNSTGKAISFLTGQEERYLNAIMSYIDKDIPLKERPEKETVNSLMGSFEEKMSTRLKIKDSKGEELNKEIMKIHINAGKKTKMRAVDIVGTLCNIEGMTANDIGIINILDISTFVEILNNKGEMVLERLQTTPIKGRLRNVNRANE